jgi:hypothetical protein
MSSNLPPGVTDRMIDEQAGAYATCHFCGEYLEDCECADAEYEQNIHRLTWRFIWRLAMLRLHNPPRAARVRLSFLDWGIR